MSLSQSFKQLLRKTLCTSGLSKEQKQNNVNLLNSFINKYTSQSSIIVILDVYLQEYQYLEINNDMDSKFISAHFFVILFSKRVETATYYDRFVQSCIELLLSKKPDSSIADTIGERFRTLNDIQKSNVIGILELKVKRKKNSLDFFDILLDFFWTTKGRDPQSDIELFHFNPRPGFNIKVLHDLRWSAVSSYMKRDEKGVESALREFAKLIKQEKNMETSFQYFLQCRRDVENMVSTPYDHNTNIITIELYLISCQCVILTAQELGYGYIISNFISHEDIEIILSPLGREYYYSSYADRLYPMAEKKAEFAGEKFIELSLLHIKLMLLSEEYDVTLASSEEYDQNLNELLQLGEGERMQRRVKVMAEQLANIGGTSLKINDYLEENVRITYIPNEHGLSFGRNIGFTWTELDGIDHVMFLTDPIGLGRIREKKFITKLVEGTEHLSILIPAFFGAIGYVPILIAGGPPALLSAILGDIVIDKIVDLTDNEYIRWIAMLYGAGRGRTNMMTKGFSKEILKEALKGLKRIRPAGILKKRPKSTIPKARVVNRSRGKNKKIKPPNTAARTSDRGLAQRSHAMVRFEEKLRKIEVNLGSGKLNGINAISQLFGENLSVFSRLAKHWPQEYAENFVKELKALMKKGARDKVIKEFVKKKWKNARTQFWKNVWADKDLVKDLKSIGIHVRSRGRAALIDMPGSRVRVTLDHIQRKVQYPEDALSIQNLRFATTRDNTVVKEFLERTESKWVSTTAGKSNDDIYLLSDEEFDSLINKMLSSKTI